MQIASNTYLTRGDGDWTVTFDDGHTHRELGHFATRSDAIAKFGNGCEQMPIRVLIGGKDVSEIREPPQAEQNRNVGQGSPDASLQNRYSHLLATLSERDRKIITYQHGLEGQREHTAAETAARFGLTRQRVYQIEKRFSLKIQRFGDKNDGPTTKLSNGAFKLIGRPYSRLLTKLPERDQQIIIYRHGLRAQHEHTLAETAARFGLSVGRIHLIDQQFIRDVQHFAYRKDKTSPEPSKGTHKPLGGPYSRLLVTLSAREQQIIIYRHGLDGESEHTAAETATRFGLGRENIHRIDTKINQKLRRWVHEEVGSRSEPSMGTHGSPDEISPKTLRVLSEREWQVLIYQCGLYRRREHTPAETAIKFGLAPATLGHMNERINGKILHWVCQGNPVNREIPDAGHVVAGSRTSLASYEIGPQSGTNTPDNESRATVNTTLIDDHAKGAIDSSTTQDPDAKLVEFIGNTLLEAPELRALGEDQPQYAAERGIAIEGILAGRIAAIRQTRTIATLLEWLAHRLWDSPPESEPLRADCDTKTGTALKGGPKRDEHAVRSLGPFAIAAQLLLDAVTFSASPFYYVWQRLVGLHSEQSEQARMSILLQHIMILDEPSRSATAVRLQGLGYADLLARDVLDAVDEVLESSASAAWNK